MADQLRRSRPVLRPGGATAPRPWRAAVRLQPAKTGAAAAAAPFIFSDRRLKENIKKVGKLDNKLPIFSYNYKGDATPRIGLMAQDVEKKHPEAVMNIGAYKAVDYSKAVEPVGD